MLLPRAHHRPSSSSSSSSSCARASVNSTNTLPRNPNHTPHHTLLSPRARAAAPHTPPPPPFATIVPRASPSSDNPLATMLGGLFGGGGSNKAGAAAGGGAGAAASTANAAAAATATPAPTASASVSFSDNAPSWEALGDLVRLQERQHDLSDRGGSFSAPDLENGPPHPLAARRLFGSDPSKIEIILYRDHAAWCPYCEKVVLVLEEKRIPYEVRKVNMRCYGPKPPEFMAKVPSGLLPVLEVDGRVVTESTAIMALLEERFSASPEKHRPLLPPQGSAERAEAETLLRLERRFFGDWLDWLCGGGGWGGGVDARQQAAAQRRFELTLAAVCAAMPGNPGPFFMGLDRPSLVDITFAPMLERAAASLAYYKGWHMRGKGQYPQIDRWFDAMERDVPSFAAFRSDYYTHAHDLPPQLGGCTMTPEGQPIAAAIDGLAGSSAWRLPLPPLSPTALPEPFAGAGGGNTGAEDEARDRLEAAARLVNNHAAVVRFALRGPGKVGARPVSAPLADPSAVAAMEHEAAADAALRHVAHALLVGVDAKQQVEGGGGEGGGGGALVVVRAGAAAQQQQQQQGSVREVVAACEYLRDRVGVPRDMRFPAARQLRAHLNWLIDQLCAV